MAYRIKNWQKFQHFKDRKPPWIKLYREILDDKDWHELPAESAKLLVMLWLIASENNGILPDNKVLAFRLRTRETNISVAFKTLNHWLEQDDISLISERYRDDPLETEREGETEKEAEKNIAVKKPAAFSLDRREPPPHTQFVESFRQTYEAKTGQPYRATQKDFVISSGLIKAHGLDACIKKAVILAGLCEGKSSWFTKDGWASYTIGKLSNQWNQIMVEARQLTPDEELQIEIKKQEEMRERANALVK